MNHPFRQAFRIALLGQLQPHWRFERALAIAVCALLATVPAVSLWALTRPAPGQLARWLASTPLTPPLTPLIAFQWDELLHRASSQTAWRDIEAFVPRRLPEIQPLVGSIFGPLSTVSERALTATIASDDSDPATENVLKQVAVENRDSLPAHYLLARWYLAHGEARRAFDIADDFIDRSAGTWRLPVFAADQAYASLGSEPALQREVLARILIRFLAGSAAISSQIADQGIPHLRVAIGYSNYLQQVALEPRAANARAIELLKGPAATLTAGEPIESLTTMSLYDALIVAYWQAKGYRDSDRGALWSREFLRQPSQQPNGDVLYALMKKAQSVPQSAPENVLWAVSNLQRIDVENERRLPPVHFVLDCAISSLLAERPEYLGPLVGPQEKSALETRARDRMTRAWTAAYGETHLSSDTLKSMVAWSGHLWGSAGGEGARLALGEHATTLLSASADLSKDWRPLAQTARWTDQLRGRKLGQIASDVEMARNGQGPVAAAFAGHEDRQWLDAWYRGLQAAYVEPLRDQLIRQLGEDQADPASAEESLAAFLALTRSTGRSAQALLNERLSDGQSLSWPVRRQAMLSDYRWWLVGSACLGGVPLFFFCWMAYVNVCRYRALVHGRFYRDEHLWLQQ
jgi:hypothetical protein